MSSNAWPLRVADTSDSSSSWPPDADARIDSLSLDGSLDGRYGANTNPRRASAGYAEEQTSIERALAPPQVPTRSRGQTVADRIKAINQPPDDSSRSSKKDHGLNARTSAPKRRSTNFNRRMNPFQRRDADAVSSPQPPLSTSKEPLKTTTIHAPIPQRQPPVLLRDRTPTTTPMHHAFEDASSPRERDQTPLPAEKGKAPDRNVSIPSFNTATCRRHGRKLPVKKKWTATTEGLEKSLSGAYIPSGRRIRHQVEPTSPYYLRASNLTKTEGTSLSPDPCPDCLAEDDIRRREESRPRAMLSETAPRDGGSPREISSTVTEPPTPLLESTQGSSLIGTASDHQAVLLPGSSVPTVEPEDNALIATDLGDMLDAIIIEHRGTLDRVITNLRKGAPDLKRVRQMSEELAQVSTELATMRPRKVEVFEKSKGQYSIILDVPPDFLKSRTKSVPDILEYIDSAAKELGLKLPARARSASPSSDDGGQVPDSGEDARPLDEAARILRERAANKSIAPPQLRDMSQDERQPAVDLDAHRSSSPLILAVNLPEVMPQSMPVPMIGPPRSMQSDFISPSTRAGSDSASTPQGATRPLAGQGLVPVPSGSSEHFGIHTPSSDGASEHKILGTKIPEPLTTPTTPRRHMSISTTHRQPAPWTRPVTSGRRDPLQALKPSEIKELRKQSEDGAAQPFVRETARNAAAKERSERRARIGKNGGRKGSVVGR